MLPFNSCQYKNNDKQEILVKWIQRIDRRNKLEEGTNQRNFSSDVKLSSLIDEYSYDTGVSSEKKEELFTNSFVQNTHKFQFMNVSQLEDQVNLLESLRNSELWSESFESALYPLMESCARLRSVKGAKLAERILARCIVESSIRNSKHYKEMCLKGNGNSISEISLTNLVNTNLVLLESIDSGKPLPSSEMYNIAIDAWGKSEAKGKQGAKRAEQILNLMIDEYVQNLYMRQKVMLEFQKKRSQAASTNLSLNDMPTLPKSAAKPDATNFSTTMSAWARCRRRDSAKQVQRIFDQMQGRASSKVSNKNHITFSVQPDSVCFNTVMSAWSRSSDKNAIDRVETIFQTLVEGYKETKNPDLHPTKYTYSILLNAYARALNSLDNSFTKEKERIIQHVEVLRLEMENSYKTDPNSPLRPDTITLNSLLNCYARAGKPQRAELVLDRMLMIQAEASAHGHDEVNMKPNVSSYNTIINGWACAASVDSGVQADRVLKRMQTENVQMKPNTITYNSVINAHTKSATKDAAPLAQQILDQMISSNLNEITYQKLHNLKPSSAGKFSGHSIMPKPSIVTFGTVINAWSSSNADEAAKNAEFLLNQIEILRSSGDFPDLNPNKRCFQGVISCFRNINNGEKAEEILLRLYEFCTKNEEVDLKFQKNNKPDTFLYNIVLSAWVNDISNPHQKAKRAHALLQWMEYLYSKSPGDFSVRPDIDSYNFVIGACAASNFTHDHMEEKSDLSEYICSGVQKEAFFIAIEVYNSLCDRASENDGLNRRKKHKSWEKNHIIAPNTNTYRLMLEMISSLLPSNQPEAMDLAKRFFLECCHDGLVNDDVLCKFKIAVTREVFGACMLTLLGSTSLDTNNIELANITARDLPAKYTCY